MINFSFDTKYGTFNDTIWVSESYTMTNDEIETMKQQRLANWLNIIETASESVDG